VMSSSFAPECTISKKRYDDCFNNWYTEKFLAGKSMKNECQELWLTYKACVDKALTKQGIMPMINEARKDAPFEKGGIPNDTEPASIENKK
ncbi:TRIAP1/MDM35 family protein, partial [Ascoidea rubescens DSM 1968]